jgi:hypothetical protein
VTFLATKADCAQVKLDQKVLHQTFWFNSSFKKLLRHLCKLDMLSRLDWSESTKDKRLRTLEADEMMLKHSEVAGTQKLGLLTLRISEVGEIIIQVRAE